MKKMKWVALLCIPFLLTGCGTKDNTNNENPTDQKGDKGDTGNGISKIEKTKTEGLVDTYTITYTDGTKTTFTVTNGKDGIQGVEGQPGKDGVTPTIEIGQNGNWIINGVDTEIQAGVSITNQVFTITYNLEGGVLNENETPVTEAKWGTTISLPTPTKKGHVFKGWYTGKTANDEKFSNADAVFKNLELFALFEPGTYTVTLDLNGGTYDGDSVLEFTYGKEYSLPTNIVKQNYDFSGWALNGEIIPNSGIYEHEDITLVAQYKDHYDLDTGELVDYIYEFEKSQITGNSQQEEHFCGAKSLVFSLGFSDNICVEAISKGATFTFVIESETQKKVPFGFGLSANSTVNNPIGKYFTIKNNGDDTMVDTTGNIPWTDVTPDVGGISQYFNMVEATGTINLVKGLNTIEITANDVGLNIDYFKLKSSTPLIDKTVPYFSDINLPKLKVSQPATYWDKGKLEIDCAKTINDNCHRVFDYLPSLRTEGYIVETQGNTKKYYIEVFGQKLLVGETLVYSEQDYPKDTGVIKDNKFEFENASIDGHTQDVKTHFCAGNSFVINPGFSGNLCLECTGEGTTFTFDVESDKQVTSEFELHVTKDYAGNRPGYEPFRFANNGQDILFDLSRVTEKDGPAPNIGWMSQYFHMVKITGTVSLVKGLNKLSFTTKCTGLNIDYFNIKTSANLIDKTIPYFNAENSPSFEVVTAPTKDAQGSIQVTCNEDPSCPKKTRKCDFLPTLNDKDYIVKSDGYYLSIIGQEIKIANL